MIAGMAVVLGAAGEVAARTADHTARGIEAHKACLSGRVQQGIDMLAELFVETGDATYIYNQGRCFQQNGRADEAITRFREFLRKAKNLTPAVIAETNLQIRECEQMRDEQRRRLPADATATDAAGKRSPATTGAPDRAAGESPAGVDTTAERRDPAAERRRAIGRPLLVVAGVALGVGLLASATTQILESQVESTNDAAGGTADRIGNMAAILQYPAYGVAALAGVSGATLVWVMGPRPSEERAAVSFGLAYRSGF